jgi:hypothetical protein
MTPSIMGLYVALSINDTQHNASSQRVGSLLITLWPAKASWENDVSVVPIMDSTNSDIATKCRKMPQNAAKCRKMPQNAAKRVKS